MDQYGDHLFMPALWREKTIVAYSRTGYKKRKWELPPGWDGVEKFPIARTTLDGLKPWCQLKVPEGAIALRMERRQGVVITP